MSECRDHQNRMEAYLAGEISPGDLRELLAHAADCEDCRATLELHRDLTREGERVPKPSARELRTMRQGVLAEITAHGARAARWSPGRWLMDLWHRSPMLRPVALVVLVALAVLAGRWSVTPPRLDDDLLLAEMQHQAAMQNDLAGFWDEPFSYTNIAVRPRSDGDLELGFDVSRHIELVTPRQSPLAREVLVHAILESRRLGTRLKAMELAPELQDARLREALVLALHNDPEPAVRLKALALLVRDPNIARGQAALFQTLRNDRSIQLRLAALEALAAQQVDPLRVRHAIQSMDLTGDRAVLQHAVQLLGSL